MDNRVEKIRELLADPTFGEELKNCEKLEDFQAAFQRNDVEMTLQETDSVLLQVAAANGEELSAEQLEQVAGGILTSILVGAGCFAVCYAVGWAVGRYARNKGGVCY